MTVPRDPVRYLLLLRDADHGDPEAGPATNRLKRALKVLLRSFGLRCDRAEELAAPPAGPLAGVLGNGDSLAGPDHASITPDHEGDEP